MIVSVWATQVTAEFQMNFVPIDPTFGDHSRTDTSCNRPDVTDLYCGGSWSNAGDPTPFLQEVVLIDGKDYYHVIVGLPEDGFAQEFYMGTSTFYQGGSGTSSLGDGICRYGSGSYGITQCNMGDALGQTHDNQFTGNGSGNPRDIIMRQVMGGTWDGGTNTWTCDASDPFCYEFTKNDFLLKPTIELTVNEPVDFMQAHFAFDMSNSNYADDTVAGSMINTVEFTDPFLSIAASHDSAVDSTDWMDITGGRYIFDATWQTEPSLEPYKYFNGNFILDREWWRYKQ